MKDDANGRGFGRKGRDVPGAFGEWELKELGGDAEQRKTGWVYSIFSQAL